MSKTLVENALKRLSQPIEELEEKLEFLKDLERDGQAILDDYQNFTQADIIEFLDEAEKMR